ncbi:hypothetical protein EGW08_002792, partial [Elysia chlorotica]
MDRIVSLLDERLLKASMGIAAAAAVCVPTSYYLYGRYMRAKMNRKIEARGQRARDKMQKMRDDLAKQELDDTIPQLSFQDLHKALQDGSLSATAVLRAYQAKALKLNDRVNAITDVLEDANAIANGLDALPSSKRGPLHGVPVSLKESCGLKGQDCTAGFGELIDVPWRADSVLVQVLKSKGAIPFVRTNLPQGMRSFACANPIYGETHSPLLKGRAPGGSSGGEGALIGGGGSILGVGSDIGGSIRIPACYCGIYALKPTAGRLSLIGSFEADAGCGQQLVKSTEGPLGRDVSCLVQFMEAVLCQEMFDLDSSTPPIPFRREMYENWKPLKIGYYVYDDCTRCVPAVERAVMLAKATLEKLGHTLVEIKPYKAFYAFIKFLIPALIGHDARSYKDLLKFDDSCGLMNEPYKFHKKSYRERWFWAKLEELQ